MAAFGLARDAKPDPHLLGVNFTVELGRQGFVDMVRVQTIEENSWQTVYSDHQQEEATREIESGGLVFFPRLAFTLSEAEKRFLVPDAVGHKVKNVSFDVRNGALRGSALEGADAAALRAMLERYARQALALVRSLLPHYAPTLEQARTSYRPVEAAGRTTSWRKDDTRLHVDAFPSSPNQGQRLLRVFSNINPEGKDRVWNIGEPFEAVAQRYLPAIAASSSAYARLLRALGITKSLRTEYDHIMLQMHDRMKADKDYQATAASMQLRMPPGSTWIVFTDSVSHAALSGQFMMEQTFLLRPAGMLDPARSPLRILERMVGRALA